MPVDQPTPLRASASTPQLAALQSRSQSSGSLSAFAPTPATAFDQQLTQVSSTAISSPSGATAPPLHSLSSSFEKKPSTEDFLKASQLASLGARQNSTDDLALTEAAPSPPVNTVPDARLQYRKWRTGLPPSGSSPPPDGASSESASAMSEVQMPDALSRSPFEQPGYLRSPDHQPAFLRTADQVPSAFLRSPEQLPRIAEKVENVPLFANSYDPDSQARTLSAQLATQEATATTGSSPVVRPQGGSFGKSRTPESSSFMKKARSYQALEDLEKTGYFPTAPKPSALGVQRGLKDSVVNDMCRAVVKHMVGDVYVSSSGQHGTKKVLNHLYEPVLQSVQIHFRRLPARYALSVNPDDVPMHMRLLAKHQRNPDDININVQLKTDDDGEIVANVCEVVVVSKDRDSLLDAITRALTSMKGSILDADVMTTHDGVTLDRFVVKGSFMSDDRQVELKRRIEERLSTEEGVVVDDKATAAVDTVTKIEEGTDTETDSNLADKLAVMEMVDKNDIKEEWRLNITEIRIDATVGSGRSGNTYSAWWRGTRVAAKVVDSSAQNAAMSEDLLNEFHREVAVVSKLRHPNIVLFLGAAIAPPKYCLVFEFMSNGSLTDVIRSKKAPLDFFRVATEIAMGMNYLHLCSIMHRDLKSGNILIDAHGTVKISDFGLSCVLDLTGSHDLTAETGTYRWMAPEVIRHEPYSTKADVYSFGVVLWEMITKDQPFRGLTPIQAAFAVARQQMRPALPRHTPQKIGELVEHCWHQDPNRRPDFAAILEALPLVKLSLKKRDFKNLGFALPVSNFPPIYDRKAQFNKQAKADNFHLRQPAPISREREREPPLGMRASFDESTMETLTTLGPTAVPPAANSKHTKSTTPRRQTVAWSENGSESRTGDRDGGSVDAQRSDSPRSRGGNPTRGGGARVKSIHKLALLIVVCQALWAWALPLINIATVVFPSTRPDSGKTQTLPYMPREEERSYSLSSPQVIPGTEVVPLLKEVLDIVLRNHIVREQLVSSGTFDIETIHKLLTLDEFVVVAKYYSLVFQSTEFPGGTFTTRDFAKDENDPAKLMVKLRDSSGVNPDLEFELACLAENAFLKATRCTRDVDGLPCDETTMATNVGQSFTDLKLQAIASNTGLENNVALLFVVDYFHQALSMLFASRDWASTLEDLHYNQTLDAALEAGTASVYKDNVPYLMDRDAFLVGVQAAQTDSFKLDSCVSAELVVGQFYIRTFVLRLIQDALIQNAHFDSASPSIIVPTTMAAVLDPIWKYNISLTSGARTTPVRQSHSRFYGAEVATTTTTSAQFKLDRKESSADQISGSSMRLLQSMVYYVDLVSVFENTKASAWDVQTYKLLGWVGSDITTFRDSFTANSLAVYNLAELPKESSPVDTWWDQEVQYATYFKTLEKTMATAPFRVFNNNLTITSAARAAPLDDDPATRCQRALYKVIGKVAYLALLEVSKPTSYLMFMGEVSSGDKNWLVTQALTEELIAESFSGERLAFAYRNGAYTRKDDGSAWVTVPLLDAMIRYFGKDATSIALLEELDRSLKLLLKGSNGNINFPDAASCRVSGAAGTASEVKASDSLDEVYDKILPGLQAGVLDLLELIPSLALDFQSAMAAANVPWVALTRDQILGSSVITSSTEGRGPPSADWQPTAFTAGLRKFWPSKTPTEDAVKKLRAATVCYKSLDTRSWTTATRCFAEPANVSIQRSQFKSERMREFFQLLWSMAIMLNTMAFVVVLKYIRKLYKAYAVTQFECLDVEVALQLNLQGMGVLNISQSLLLLVASLPALISFHVPDDEVFMPVYTSEKLPKVVADVFATLSMSWFVKLGFDVCNTWIKPKRPVDWYYLFRVRWLAMVFILILRLVTPEHIARDSYVTGRLVVTCLGSLFLGVCCTCVIFLPERGSKVVDADRKGGHDAVVAALVKQNMPLTRYGVLGRTSKGWSKTGLLVEGWRLGRSADGGEVLRKDGGEILLPRIQDEDDGDGDGSTGRQRGCESSDAGDEEVDVLAVRADSSAIMTASSEVTL